MSKEFEGPRGLELARLAIEEMARRDVAPTPQNYAIWSSYVAGVNMALAHDLQKAIDAGLAFTDELAETLWEKHFTHMRLGEETLDAGSRMKDQLARALAMLEAAGRSTRAYGEKLEDATGGLTDIDDPERLRAMVQMLADATRQMQNQSMELERKLQKTSQEVTVLRANLEKVREEALTDALTGVANRKRLDDALREVCQPRPAEDGARPEAAPSVSLIIADIDHFKHFNDTWGHQTGDQIIRFVASTLQRSAGKKHLVARYGGEEFAVLMPGVDAAEAAGIAEEMRAAVEAKKLVRRSTNENLGNVTISLGVAQLEPREEVWAFVERADQRLYAAKQAGRNCISVADAEGPACAPASSEESRPAA